MKALSPIPLPRTMIAVDIEGSTTRNNSATAVLRNDLYDVFEAALDECGITDDLRDDFCDRGDGLIAFIHAVDQAPKTLAVSRFIPALTRLLGKHAAEHPKRKFRLRVAIHAGDAHFDARGPFGEDVNITARLVDAPELKSALRQTSAPIVLVVSDYIHRSVVRHGYDGIAEDEFKPLIHFDVGDEPYRGWVQLSGQTHSIGKTIPLIGRVSSRARSAGRSASRVAGRAQVARWPSRTTRTAAELAKKAGTAETADGATATLRSG